MGRRNGGKLDPIVKKIFLAMLAPTILMNLTTAIGSMADTVIIGHYLDDASLSVVTFATPIYMLINTFAALFAVGGCISMSIDAGKGEKKQANASFSIAIEMLLFIGILLFCVGLFFSGPVARLLGAGKDVLESVRVYAQIILLGAPLFVLNIGVAFFVRNDGRPSLSMAGMLLSIFVDIILNLVFVGALQLGVAGAAYSTVLGQLVSLLVIGSHFLSSKNTLRFRFTMGKAAFRILKNGASAALQFVYQFLTILILNHFLTKLAGTDGVVVYTVVFNLATVSLSVFEGISQTIQPMISNYHGEGSVGSIRHTLRLAVLTVFLICGTVTVLLELFPNVVPLVFGLDDGELIRRSCDAVRLYALSMILTTLNVVLGYYLQSTEQSILAAILISLRSFVLFLLATIVLEKLFGMNGVWSAYLVAEVLSALICLVLLRAKQKKLQTNGIRANLLLMDTSLENSIETVTFPRKDFSLDEAEEWLKRRSFPSSVHTDAIRYLEERMKSEAPKKDACIRLEAIGAWGKLIIRDNLTHAAVKIPFESKAETSPVLGWNRLCLTTEGAENA